jgi:hypothetical protein
VFSLAYVTLGCWVVLEVSLLVRDRVRARGGRVRDRGTRTLIRVAIGAAITAATVAASRAPSLRMPFGYRVAGVFGPAPSPRWLLWDARRLADLDEVSVGIA